MVSNAAPAGFDAVADAYDAAFTQRRLGRLLREAVRRHLQDTVTAGDALLELGCGTGEDAVWLAEQGVRVTAIDASVAMLDVARDKAEVVGVDGSITFLCSDLAEFSGRTLDRAVPSEEGYLVPQFDAVFSNFGALNCLPNRRSLAATLARCVRPGGRLVFAVMGPICPWEIGWHLLHGEVGTAFRRFRTGVEAHVGAGGHVRVWYPSPRRLRSEFAAGFRYRYTAGIGALLPPSYLDHLVDRWPALFARLNTLERRLERVFPWTWLNDHYLIVFERR